ncbi:uncharacterized protein [Linepithema humile]|uniref:uncharacterized protein n=1 Tax=Linepithema humile TaxID=83485 RepID=UPI00351F6C85
MEETATIQKDAMGNILVDHDGYVTCISEEKMKSQGYNVSAIQVENKYKSLERSFKNVITHNKKTGRNKLSCPYETSVCDINENKENNYNITNASVNINDKQCAINKQQQTTSYPTTSDESTISSISDTFGEKHSKRKIVQKNWHYDTSFRSM